MSRWHYKLGQDEHGPVSLAELVELARKGAVTEATLVRDDTGGAWLPAWTLPVVFPAPRKAVYASPASKDGSKEPLLRTPKLPVGPGRFKVVIRAARSMSPRTARMRIVFALFTSGAATLLVYRLAYWRNMAFPQPLPGGSLAAKFEFPLLGTCTTFEGLVRRFRAFAWGGGVVVVWAAGDVRCRAIIAESRWPRHSVRHTP
jgi:hypothetical protein